jgi:hypothetical protein
MNKILLTLIITMLPTLTQAYGTRDWLVANQHYNRDLQHHRHTRGLNYMEGARRTTIHSEDDRMHWSNVGNLRNNNSNSLNHWRRESRKRVAGSLEEN